MSKHGTTEKMCSYCGESFQKRNDRLAGEHHFCSRKCSSDWRASQGAKKTFTCEYCGKEVSKYREFKTNFCDKECYVANQKKNANPDADRNHRGWGYTKWRNSVYRKDGYSCIKCNSKKDLNAHHILSWKHYPSLRYEVENGATLCLECHKELHRIHGKDSKERVI